MAKFNLDGINGPDTQIEHSWRLSGYHRIAGIDEAGRGPLAGPVVAAAIILDLDDVPQGLDDSKKLTEKRRLLLFDQIVEKAVALSICSISAEHIDAINIRQATLRAMTKAAHGLSIPADFCLIDGRDVPPALAPHAEAYIKGDSRSVSIAAASIVAKTIRDRMMKIVPDMHYGHAKHMGYGSKQHRAALSTHGGVPRIHRYSFAPLKHL